MTNYMKAALQLYFDQVIDIIIDGLDQLEEEDVINIARNTISALVEDDIFSRPINEIAETIDLDSLTMDLCASAVYDICYDEIVSELQNSNESVIIETIRTCGIDNEFLRDKLTENLDDDEMNEIDELEERLNVGNLLE